MQKEIILKVFFILIILFLLIYLFIQFLSPGSVTIIFNNQIPTRVIVNRNAVAPKSKIFFTSGKGPTELEFFYKNNKKSTSIHFFRENAGYKSVLYILKSNEFLKIKYEENATKYFITNVKIGSFILLSWCD